MAREMQRESAASPLPSGGYVIHSLRSFLTQVLKLKISAKHDYLATSPDGQYVLRYELVDCGVRWHSLPSFFETNKQAEAAGYRACKRCFISQGNAEEIIKNACAFIATQETMPKLNEVAAYAGLSPNHFQRLFSDVLGISPRSYSDSQRQQLFRELLQKGDEITGAPYEAGYSSSSRVYEFANCYLGMTPKDYQQGGKNYKVWFTLVSSSLGKLLIAATKKGVCSVRLGDDENALRMELAQEFHDAELIESDKYLTEWTQTLVDYLAGKSAWPTLPYDLKATAFQCKVWEWLRTIPAG